MHGVLLLAQTSFCYASFLLFLGRHVRISNLVHVTSRAYIHSLGFVSSSSCFVLFGICRYPLSGAKQTISASSVSSFEGNLSYHDNLDISPLELVLSCFVKSISFPQIPELLVFRVYPFGCESMWAMCLFSMSAGVDIPVRLSATRLRFPTNYLELISYLIPWLRWSKYFHTC